jgi:hypothetical protein
LLRDIDSTLWGTFKPGKSNAEVIILSESRERNEQDGRSEFHNVSQLAIISPRRYSDELTIDDFQIDD